MEHPDGESCIPAGVRSFQRRALGFWVLSGACTRHSIGSQGAYWATDMRARRRKVLLRTAAIFAAISVLAFAWARYLVRDPEPYFRARRGVVAAVEVGPLRSDGDSDRQDVRVVSTTGLAVEMAIRRPIELTITSGDKERPAAEVAPSSTSGATVGRPLFVLLGGHVTGREAIELVRETEGAVVAALSYPYEGSSRLKGWAVVRAVPKIRRALRDTPPAVMLALDFLLEQPYVDPTRVELVGVSLGAPFACIAGALDERFARVWSIDGAGDLLALLDHNLEGRIPFDPARAIVTRLAHVAAGGAGLAPERWVGRIAPREIVMVNAEEDERLPRACIDCLHSAAREPKDVIWRPGLHVEPSRTEIVQGLLAVVLARER